MASALVVIACGGGAGGFAVAASGTAGSSTTDQAPVTYGFVGQGTLPVVSSDQEALDAALAGPFARSDVTAASLAAPPSGAPAGDWLDASITATDDGAGATLGDFESAVLAGVLRDEAHAAGLTPISGFTVTATLPSGETTVVDDGRVGNVAFGQGFTTAAESMITSEIENDAASVGATITSIRYLHAIDPVPIVVVSATDPQTFLAAHPNVGVVIHSAGSLEGYYVELTAADGAPVAIEWASYRTAVGDSWYAPGYDQGSYFPYPGTTGAS